MKHHVAPRLRITAFASGQGSTVEHLLRYQERENPSWHLTGIICDNPSAGVLNVAENHAVPIAIVERRNFANNRDFNSALMSEVTRQQPDVIFLMGYLRKIGSDIIERYKGRIFNSHPSLLPKYGGKGMYGLAVHEAVIKAAEVESGVSIHEVNENYDEGAVRLQKRLPVEKGWSGLHLEEAVKRLEKDTIVEFLNQLSALTR